MYRKAGSPFLPVFINPLPTENTKSITNGVTIPGGPAAPGQQMSEKMRPGRQDPGDNDAGEELSLHSSFLSVFVIDCIL